MVPVALELSQLAAAGEPPVMALTCQKKPVTVSDSEGGKALSVKFLKDGNIVHSCGPSTGMKITCADTPAYKKLTMRVATTLCGNIDQEIDGTSGDAFSVACEYRTLNMKAEVNGDIKGIKILDASGVQLAACPDTSYTDTYYNAVACAKVPKRSIYLVMATNGVCGNMQFSISPTVQGETPHTITFDCEKIPLGVGHGTNPYSNVVVYDADTGDRLAGCLVGTGAGGYIGCGWARKVSRYRFVGVEFSCSPEKILTFDQVKATSYVSLPCP